MSTICVPRGNKFESTLMDYQCRQQNILTIQCWLSNHKILHVKFPSVSETYVIFNIHFSTSAGKPNKQTNKQKKVMKYKTSIYSQRKMDETVMILLRPAKPVTYTAHSPKETIWTLGGICISKCDDCISVTENLNKLVSQLKLKK